MSRRVISYFWQSVTVTLWYLLIWLPAKIDKMTKKANMLYLKLLMKMDPLPDTLPNEATSDWLKRIDLKHAERYANYMHLGRIDIDYDAFEERIGEYPRKRDKKILRELASLVTQMNTKNEEYYRIVMARKAVEESLKS